VESDRNLHCAHTFPSVLVVELVPVYKQWSLVQGKSRQTFSISKSWLWLLMCCGRSELATCSIGTIDSLLSGRLLCASRRSRSLLFLSHHTHHTRVVTTHLQILNQHKLCFSCFITISNATVQPPPGWRGVPSPVLPRHRWCSRARLGRSGSTEGHATGVGTATGLDRSAKLRVVGDHLQQHGTC
jgi:hypothetical protein